jgi:hypothetical protein
VAGFSFLPPVTNELASSGDFDDSLLDLLAIEICEWSGSACANAPSRITAQSAMPAQLRISDNAYHAVWKSSGDLDPERTYRIRVLAGTGELGHVDVDIVDPGATPAPGQTNYVRLVRGAALPIRFFVDESAGERTGSEGGSVELADGAVQLDVPAGALTQDVFLTAVPTTDVPSGGPPVVAGTAWDMGPDGLVFAKPVVLTIPYDPANIPAGVDEAELRIHKVVNGEFEQQNAGVIDLAAHTVSAEVDGFSVFVVIPRDPVNPEDLLGPELRAIEVFDPSLQGFVSSITLDVSNSDAHLRTRVRITDNITGVSWVDVRYISPTGRQVRFPCYRGGLPNSGSDTNGFWECDATFPQHTESGTWRAQFVLLTDRINNIRTYLPRPTGLCAGTSCVNPAQITVNSATPDLDQPVILSAAVSLPVAPRAFGSSVVVDATTGPRPVFFGFQATDNLSGVGNFQPFDNFNISFTGPSNQTQQWGSCSRTQGTNLNGFWECIVVVPAQAENGTWRISRLRFPDRVGNGGWSVFSDYTPNATGQLCNRFAACITPPTVQVSSAGDSEPPALQGLTITSNQSGTQTSVTTSLAITDNLSGGSFVRVRYQSTAANQFQECFAALSSGNITNGSWSCTLNFSQFAARGQWVLQVEIRDRAGNMRFYSRRSTDGFLCFFDPAQGTVCQDFGSTDLILQ